MKLDDWPTNEEGEPLTAVNLVAKKPVPTFLANFNHQVKSVGKVL